MSDYEADWRWLLAFLRRNGGRATLNEIHYASLKERGTNLTPHSRADNIRKHFEATGAAEELYCCTWGKTTTGKVEWLYWLGPRGLGRGARPSDVKRPVTRETWDAVMGEAVPA